jgi:hypothetical protein
MKCVLCNQRKGKRPCPAKNAGICGQCCGEKRILEIECPEGCEYLKAGRDRETSQEGARHFRVSDPFEQEKIARVVENHEPVLADLQTIIAVERQYSRDLTDQDVAEALDCLLKTLRTEDHGVLYETTAENLRAEGLRRQFSSLIQSRRYPDQPEQKRLPLKDAIECLQVIRAVVASHLKAGPSALSFVNFLLRRLPHSSRIGAAQPSIIVPGR